jgi:hypothetical protein
MLVDKIGVVLCRRMTRNDYEVRLRKVTKKFGDNNTNRIFAVRSKKYGLIR